MQSAARLRRSPKPVLAEIYIAILESNVRWRGISSAASVASGSFNPQKGRRLTKQERRALVESVVEKYRAENGGRFPFVSHVRKETGGHHYTVRLIFQELVYNHMHSPSNNTQEVQLEKAEKATYPISGVKEELSVPEQESMAIPTAHGILKDDASISDVQVNSEVQETVVASTLAEEKLQINKQDSSDGQESIAYSDDTHIVQILKDDASLSNVQVSSEVQETVVASTLAEEKLQISKQDSSDGQESITYSDDTHIAQILKDDASLSNVQVNSEESISYSDDTHIVQADVSFPVKSDVTVETTSSASGVTEGSEKNIRATECLQAAPEPSIDLTENQGITKPEELSSDQGQSSAMATGIWGNLKSLADGIIGFWWRK